MYIDKIETQRNLLKPKNKDVTQLINSFLQTNVIQQSSRSQAPELQGDADNVLARFQ